MDTIATAETERLRPPHGVGPAMFSLMLGTFTIGTGEFGMMGLLPEFAQSLGVPITRASFAISAYALGVVIGAPLIAVAGARLPRRTVLLLLLCLFVIGNIGSILMPGLIGVEIMRFVSGLPHGAFFGIAALIGASMVERAKRGRAIGQVLCGIMVSTVIGSPLCTFATEYLTWRVVYGAIAVLGALCFVGIWYFIPQDAVRKGTNAFSELEALKRPQVLLTLLTAAVGFGGLFSVYTFLTTALAHATHLPTWKITLYQIIWGCGMVAGNSFGGAMIDRTLNLTLILSFCASALLMMGFWWFLPSPVPMMLIVFLIPAATIILAPALQSRLMDVAGDAQTMAAALNHSAFNVANAVGAWLGAVLVGAGYGLGSIGWGGALLSLGGLAIYLITLLLARRDASP